MLLDRFACALPIKNVAPSRRVVGVVACGALATLPLQEGVTEPVCPGLPLLSGIKAEKPACSCSWAITLRGLSG